MSKNKKMNKVLVRNPSIPVRPCKIIQKNDNVKKVHFSEDVLPEAGNPTFSAPEFCTILQLADEMKSIRNSQDSSRSLPEVSKYRHLNFLPEERLYQDLVGLDLPDEDFVNEVRSQPCVKLNKDPELDLNKYLKPDLLPEYFFTCYAVPLVKKQRTGFNGYSVYNKIAMWKECTD